MYVKSLTLHNFKSFEDQTFSFSKGMNFFVGNNNTGKTTVLNALDFLINGGSKEEVLCNFHGNSTEVSVQAELGDVKLPNSKDRKKYTKYIDANGNLTIKRSSKQELLLQSGKTVGSSIKKILFKNR